MTATGRTFPTTSHWGAYGVRVGADGGITVVPHPDDPAPSPLLANIPGALRHPTRVARPAVRRGWLEGGPGPADGRGREEFVELDLCVHGNPNVLTADVPTSRLSQGCVGQHALVEIERWVGELPPLTVTTPPPGTRPWSARP
ncbi:hypothetical protein [Frankia sp. Cr2]|uniref:hypothetical protein n=1 Tax=Frankia sp. Cr2 TaxID=3073932 RepID=UPI002AD48FAE|nr:hypothetical protein [Frankia sp. Cr2]